MSNIILQNVRHRRASCNTKYHCLYGYYFLRISRSNLSVIYRKSKTTISSWIMQYEEAGLVTENQRKQIYKKFGAEHRSWIVQQYQNNPVLFLDECSSLFYRKFHKTISVASICRILHSEGLTWKALERRAIQIREDEIFRFFWELNSLDWDLFNLVFLDEVSIDNRDMLRNRGYGIKGEKLVFRGEFVRRPRVSFLCFLGQKGMLDSFETEGTFTRKLFFECLRLFALENKNVFRYPGANSVWILDGARIHCDQNIVLYLRSIGIFPVFLPPYCPFFNPIEIIFGITKKSMIKTYNENRRENLSHVAISTFSAFSTYDCTKIFRHCGYLPGGQFDPAVGLSNSMEKIAFE
ncbi:uncharacterized protein LOC128745977 [Sabethes cyaneus]|uniref:uncharacterized protein LOC128736311 n=1 Tax=Sabethes cyaneus TaxID=53552 RepID=UPI00237E96A9|nr:uncharacterized protein LOC128736311 [Sabethes cyaneus]XP_053699007.1 uncharacterized protein LOC128745977 [Sabethes cyaneus]